MPARGRVARHSLRWLHSVSRLVQQGQRQNRVETLGDNVESRRWKQRQAMGRTLIDQPMIGWKVNQASGSRYWMILRWAGLGFSLAWWMAKR